jgi:hypothetical protein
MMFSRFFRRCAALAAAAAIALQALWPLLAQARPQHPTLQVPLCSIDGAAHSVEIKVSRTTPLDERSASHGEHCKLCVLGTDQGSVIPARMSFDFSSSVENQILVENTRPRQFSFVLRAHSRAPPQAS